MQPGGDCLQQITSFRLLYRHVIAKNAVKKASAAAKGSGGQDGEVLRIVSMKLPAPWDMGLGVPGDNEVCLQAMEILRTISLYVEGKDMPFVVIGGHAVNAYGLSRQTGDLDLIVPLTAKGLWLELMNKLRYRKGQDDDRFTRFRPEHLTAWPIDLMFVDDGTFAKIWEAGDEKDYGAVPAKVASARHLAILKMHALKHYQEHRYARDYNDLIGLLRSGETGISAGELSELCLKYANQEVLNRLLQDQEKR